MSSDSLDIVSLAQMLETDEHTKHVWIRPTANDMAAFFEPNGLAMLYGIKTTKGLQNIMCKRFANMQKHAQEYALQYNPQIPPTIELVSYIPAINGLCFLWSNFKGGINENTTCITILTFITGQRTTVDTWVHGETLFVTRVNAYVFLTYQEERDKLLKLHKVGLTDKIQLGDVFKYYFIGSKKGLAKNTENFSLYQVVGFVGQTKVKLREISYKVVSVNRRVKEYMGLYGGKSLTKTMVEGQLEPCINDFVSDAVIIKEMVVNRIGDVFSKHETSGCFFIKIPPEELFPFEFQAYATALKWQDKDYSL